jgi:hypothetical protein
MNIFEHYKPAKHVTVMKIRFHPYHDLGSWKITSNRLCLYRSSALNQIDSVVCLHSASVLAIEHNKTLHFFLESMVSVAVSLHCVDMFHQSVDMLQICYRTGTACLLVQMF